MAQVKKFQPGGKLTISGKDYTIDQINEYMNSGGFSSQERAALAGIVNSIAGGASRNFDRNANSISGEGVTSDLAEFYGSKKKAEKNQGKSTRWANRQARWNSDHHIVNTALERLGGIEDYYNKEKEEKSSEKTRLYKGSDENGFYTSDGRFIEGPENMQNISRITAILDAMQSGDLSKYDLQDWGGDTTLGGLVDWYSAQNGTFNREEFFNRLRSNQLTDLDWEVLSKMGFVTGTTPTTSSTTSHKDWKGNADAATRAGVYFTKNADGTWSINGNEDYLNSTWYGGGLDFLTGTEFEGGGIHNGRLYTRQQILNNDPALQGAFASWMAARSASDYRGWYDKANASRVRFVGDRTSRGAGADDYGIFNTQFNPYTHYNEYWSDYFNGLGLGNRAFDIADMSQTYTNLDGRQVLAYVDPNNTYDNMGIRSVKYVVRNADGTYTPYDSEAALAAAGFVTNNDSYGFTPGEVRKDLWETIGNKRYHFAYDLVTFGDQNNVIMQGEDGKFYLARKNGDQHLNPKLIRNEELLKQMLENPQNYKNIYIEQLTKQPMYVPENKNIYEVARGFRRKNGGLIKPLPEKFQYGGNLGKTTTVGKENSTEGKRTDITSTHKTNGSDGGLSDAEKMQIAAAVGDLAGVGLSFVPGARVAGSIAGLGATATRFAADVKKDGFQGKDFWAALGGAALDVASLVPILGTGAKTAKAVKALKAAATPIMKALSIAGAINGAQAMGKVIRGEEVTAEDITAILSGLGSAAIAGKQLKDAIGDARLARMVAQKAKTFITGKTLGQTLPKSRKEISELLEKAGTEKKAIDEVKKLLGNNASDESAKKVLKEWGVDTNQSRFKGKEGWKEYLKFWKKGEATVSIKNPDIDVKSVLGYTLNPFARTKQLGYDIGYKQSSGNLGLIREYEYDVALRAVMNGTATGKQIALVRRSALNPKGFSFEFEGASNRNPGWGWPIMGRQIAPHENRAVVAEAIGPDGNPIVFRSPKAPTQGPIRNLTPLPPTREVIGIGFDGKPIYAEPVVSGRRARLVKEWSDLHNFGAEGYKNGGKIQFAKNGRKITKHQNTSVLPDYLKSVWSQVGGVDLSQKPETITTENFATTPDYSAASKVVANAIRDTKAQAAESALNETGPQTITTNYAKDHDTAGKNTTRATTQLGVSWGEEIVPYTKQKSVSSGGSQVGTSNKSDLWWNIAGNIAASVGKAATAFAASKRQMDLAKQMQVPLETAPVRTSFRYKDPGIDLAYNNAINQQQSYARNFKSADQALNAAVGLQTADKVAQLELERGLKKAQVFSEQMGAHNAQLREERAQDAAIANTNAQRLAQKHNALLQQKGAYIAQNEGIAQGLINDVAGIGQRATAATKALDRYNLQDEYNAKMKDWRTEYQNGVTDGKHSSGLDFDDWVQDKYEGDIKDFRRRSITLGMKKGGRIRSASEQIRIDNNKIRAKAIQQLSKQAFELLKMALS